MPLPAQSPRVIAPDYQSPYTWQSSIGFQKQINAVTGFEVDLTHWNEYRDTRTIDPNLFYNPATGYNRNPRARAGPNPTYGQIQWLRHRTAAPTTDADLERAEAPLRRTTSRRRSPTPTCLDARRRHHRLHGARANNPFDYLDGEWATSTDFQRHTLRFDGIWRLPCGISTSVHVLYGSGNRYQRRRSRLHAVRQAPAPTA